MTTKQAKQKRQNRLGTVLAILIFLLGLGILFYPVASDLWNQHRQNQLISHYTQSTTTLAPEDHSALWEAAQEYNKNLSPTFRDAFTGRQLPAGDPYWGLLDLDVAHNAAAIGIQQVVHSLGWKGKLLIGALLLFLLILLILALLRRKKKKTGPEEGNVVERGRTDEKASQSRSGPDPDHTAVSPRDSTDSRS